MNNTSLYKVNFSTENLYLIMNENIVTLFLIVKFLKILIISSGQQHFNLQNSYSEKTFNLKSNKSKKTTM
jgi:hypothetical protein